MKKILLTAALAALCFAVKAQSTLPVIDTPSCNFIIQVQKQAITTINNSKAPVDLADPARQNAMSVIQFFEQYKATLKLIEAEKKKVVPVVPAKKP